MNSARLVEDLQRPEAYGLAGGSVSMRQTHISWLFFTAERVYKVKQPVELGFLDFTTLERRRHFCEEEVRLNRRLAPDVYLGVVPLTRGADAHLRVGGPGEPVEWAVEMVRLPAHRMLDQLLDRGEVDNGQMNDLAALLAGFHAAAPTGAGVDEHGSRAGVRVNVEENLAQLQPFVEGTAEADLVVLSRRQHDFLRRRRAAFLDGNAELFERRVREGRIREGHGDLHAENVCFTADGVVAYDCIEFNRRFRCGDVAADLAFLTMDLDDRGFHGFAGYLARRYAKTVGDDELALLEPFYKSYRAVVRGKVAALTAVAPELDATRRRTQRLRALRYVQLALGYELPPAIVLLCGLPACGKSWLAKRIAHALRAPLLQSDVRRKTLVGIQPTDRVEERYGAGLYSEENKDRTYRSLLHDALGALRGGHACVLDATFAARRHRSLFRDAAARLDMPLFVVHVTASEELTRARMEARARDPRRATDASYEIYLRARERFEPPDELPSERLLRVVSEEREGEEQVGRLVDLMIAAAN